MDNRIKLLEVAKQCLGKDLVPFEDTLACAGQVNAIYKKAFGREIGGGLSTYQMYYCLKSDNRFLKVAEGLPGDIVISPTGLGDSKKIRNGHVGIVMEQGQIASNDSLTGLFQLNYTFLTWQRRWKDYGRYPMDYFRVVSPPEVPAPQAIPQPVVIPQPIVPQTLMPMWLRFFLDRSALGALRSPKWSELQKITVTNHPFCAFHGGKGTLLNPLNVHHIKMFMEYPELELDPNNLLVACRFCHFWYCHKGNWKKLNIHSKEDADILLSHIEQS